MKLHFNKNDRSDITVQIEKNLDTVEFDYVEMLKQLIVDNNIECDWNDIDANEQSKLQELLDKIKAAVKAGLEKPLE